MEKYYRKWFWLLILPAMLLFLFVIAVPFIVGTVYSFTSWRGTYFAGGSFLQSFVGLENYWKAFSDEKFVHSLVYTCCYTLVAVISINIVALAFSLMLNHLKRSVGFFRTVFFLPNMLGGLAMGFVWQFIFQVVYTDLLFSPEGLFHVEFLRYMTQDTTKALFALVIMTVWQSAGYMMLIYISGLNSVPGELYEAAEIDGSGPFRTFFTVTLPLLMPSVTIVLFLTLANSFKLLDQNIALTNGDFNTRLIALQILRTVQDGTPPDYGTAQAQAVVFFVIVAVISLLQVSFTRRKEVEY